MKLNFITAQGSTLETTSCASRAWAPSWPAPVGASRAAGRLCDPALAGAVAALPVLIALPGLPVLVGLGFFLVRVPNGALTWDFASPDGTPRRSPCPVRGAEEKPEGCGEAADAGAGKPEGCGEAAGTGGAKPVAPEPDMPVTGPAGLAAARPGNGVPTVRVGSVLGMPVPISLGTVWLETALVFLSWWGWASSLSESPMVPCAWTS